MMAQRVFLLAALCIGLAGSGLGQAQSQAQSQALAQTQSQALAQVQSQPQAQLQLQAPPLGRLFSTPEERTALDAQRGTAGAIATPAPPPAAAEPAPPAPPVTLNGIVRRSSGKSTVWLNQVPQDDQRNVSGSALSLRSANGRKLTLKPGQSVDLNDGSVREAHER